MMVKKPPLAQNVQEPNRQIAANKIYDHLVEIHKLVIGVDIDPKLEVKKQAIILDLKRIKWLMEDLGMPWVKPSERKG